MTQAGTRPFFGWIIVALMFGVYGISLGVAFYGFSAVFPQMVAALEWDRGAASIGHTVTVLMMGGAVPLVALCINRLGSKVALAIGFVLLILVMGLLGTAMNAIWQWIVLWGVLGGLAFGFAGTLPVQTIIMQWFNINRATALGITTTGAAVGGIIALPLYTWVIETTGSWRSGWLTGMAFAIVGLALTFFVVNKPSDMQQTADGVDSDQSSGQSQAKTAKTYRSPEDWNLRDALATPGLYILAVAMVCYLTPVILVNTHGVLHLTDIGFTQMDAVSVLGAILFGSALSRIPGGWVGDRIEPRFVLLFAFLLQLGAFWGLWKPSGTEMAITAAVMFGISVGIQMSLFPIVLGNYFGAGSFATINGAVGPVLVLFVALVPVSGGYVFDSFGSYDLAFIAMGCVHLLGAVLSLVMLPPKHPEYVQELVES